MYFLRNQTMRSYNLYFFLVIYLLSFVASATDLKVGDLAPNFKLQATNGDYYQ